jgi:mRNA-degrading endonuclease RelE of RelBE toxin-antitoxin system
MFNIRSHPKASKEIQNLLRTNREISKEIKQILQELAEKPYSFAKKKGKIKSCRAIGFKVKGNAWRLVFRIIEAENYVEILAVDLHDEAYSSAERRI